MKGGWRQACAVALAAVLVLVLTPGLASAAQAIIIALAIESVIAQLAIHLAVYAVSTLVTNALFGQKKSPAQSAFNAEQQGFKVVTRTAIANRRLIYGEVKCAGPLIYTESTGELNTVLHMVIPLATHEIDSFRDIYLGETRLGPRDAKGRVDTAPFAIGSEIVGYSFILSGAARSVPLAGLTYFSTVSVTADDGFGGQEVFTEVPLGSPSPGPLQYAVDDGHYTFNAADNGKQFTITYRTQDPWVTAREHLGTTTQDAEAQLVAESAGQWTDNHRLRGIAYLYIRLRFNQANNRWPTGLPNVACVIRGKKLYDPRTALTAWSDNPALVMRDYLTNEYGLRADTAEIDDATFIAAANVCDERVLMSAYTAACTFNAANDTLTFTDPENRMATGDGVQVVSTGSPAEPAPGGLALLTTFYVIRSGADTAKLATSYANALADVAIDITSAGFGTYALSHIDQARYTCNGIVDLGKKPMDIINAISTACAGALVYTQGQYQFHAGAYATPTVTLTEDDLRGPIRIRPRMGRKEAFNQIKGTYIDPFKSWEATDFPVVVNTAAVTEDGEDLVRDVEMPFTTNVVRAQRIAKIHLQKALNSRTIEFPAKLTAFKLSVWDNVMVSIDRAGLASSVHRVLEWRLNPDSGGVDLVLQADAAASYDWTASDATNPDPVDPPPTPDPYADLDITTLTASSGTAELLLQGDGSVVPRVRLAWEHPGNGTITEFRMEYAVAAGSPQEWVDGGTVTGDQLQGFLTGAQIEDGQVLDLRVKAVTGQGTAGEWAYVYSHTVIGKTEAPSDVTGFSAGQQGTLVVFGCNTVTDVDLDTVEVRIADYGNTTWDDASPLTNILRGETATSAAAPPGTWTFLAKAKDTSGNYSANAARADATVTAQGYTTITSAQYAPDWQGEIYRMVKHWSGVIVPDSQSLASALGWEVFDQFVPNAYTDCYFTSGTLDKSVDASARIYADIISTLGPGESGTAAPMLEVDYRTTAGSFDGFEAWTIGLANFRYVQGRIHVDTTVGKPVISGFDLVVDAPTRAESGVLTVGGGGSGSVSFGTAFHTAPSLQLTPEGSGDVSASYSALTNTGFTGYYKSGGVAAAGNIGWNASGA